MYRPMWPVLLMYGCHDMRHTGFPQVDGGQRDPRELGRHKMYRCSTKMCPTGSAKNMFMLDFGPEYTKALDLVNAREFREIIVFPNLNYDAPKPGGPLTTRQSMENLHVSYYEIHT